MLPLYTFGPFSRIAFKVNALTSTATSSYILPNSLCPPGCADFKAGIGSASPAQPWRRNGGGRPLLAGIPSGGSGRGIGIGIEGSGAAAEIDPDSDPDTDPEGWMQGQRGLRFQTVKPKH